MRAILLKFKNASRQNKKTLMRVAIPLFVLFLFILSLPQVTFAFSLFNPIDSMKDFFSEMILTLARSVYLIGLGLVKISAKLTDVIVGTDAVKSSWKSVRSMSLGLFGIILLAIALMNILRIDTKTIQIWGVGRMIPKLAGAILLVIFSRFICVTLLNFSNALTTTFTEGANIFQPFQTFGDNIGQGKTSITMAVLTLSLSTFAFLVLLFLAIILMFRALMLVFLVIFSPIAFTLMVLPWTEKFFMQWGKELMKWIFFFPIAMLILTVGANISNEVAVNGGLAIETGQNGADEHIVNLFANFGVMLVSLISIPLAVFVPLKLLGAVGNVAQGLVKKGANAGKSWAWNRAGGAATTARVKAGIDQRRTERGRKVTSFWAKGGPDFMHGITRETVQDPNDPTKTITRNKKSFDSAMGLSPETRRALRLENADTLTKNLNGDYPAMSQFFDYLHETDKGKKQKIWDALNPEKREVLQKALDTHGPNGLEDILTQATVNIKTERGTAINPEYQDAAVRIGAGAYVDNKYTGQKEFVFTAKEAVNNNFDMKPGSHMFIDLDKEKALKTHADALGVDGQLRASDRAGVDEKWAEGVRKWGLDQQKLMKMAKGLEHSIAEIKGNDRLEAETMDKLGLRTAAELDETLANMQDAANKLRG